MTEAEETLVRSAQGGDRAAFEELVRRTTRLVYSRLYMETGNPFRAEDLVQETFLTAFRSIGQLANPGGFRSWLMSIAQNVAIDAARRDLRLKRATPPRVDAEAIERLPATSPSPDEELSRREARGRVLSILRSMPEEYRLPLMMRYLGGADYETISTQTGLSNGSLRGILHRGLEMLRGEMKRAVGNEVTGG